MATTNATIKHFKTRSNYDKVSQGGGISQGDLVFIKDKQQIITHGQVYDCGNYEANLKWGNRVFNNDFGVLDAAMIPDLGANRFAFLNPSGVTIQLSKDAGNTWTDFNDDTLKKTLFSTGNKTLYLGGNIGTGATIDWKSRIILKIDSSNIYAEIRKIVIYASTGGSKDCKVLIERSKDGLNWATLANSYLGGWSGWNVIPIEKIRIGISEYAIANYLRFTFSIGKASTTYSNFEIFKIMAFGGTAWTTPSNMASNGHLYSFDSNQNATFPAGVTATQLKGNLDWSYIQNKPSSYDMTWTEYE